MERVRTMIRAAGIAAAFALTTGCIHVHTDADGRVKSVEVKASEPKAKTAPADQQKTDPAVKQAAATIPAAVTALPKATLAKLTGKGEQAKGAPIEIAVAWHNRPAQLPDPTKNGALVNGLVGQMFLFGPGSQPAPANGQLVVEMFDETPGPGATSGPRRLGGWTFDKERLRLLMLMDERFGKCYALFLPWPDYKPDVTRVRLTTRFDPDHGYPLFAPPSSLTLDTAANGTTGGPAVPAGGPITMGPTPPGAAIPAAGFMGIPAGAQPAPSVLPPLNPLPIGGGSATGQPAATPPPGLAPIAFTVPARR